MFLSTKEVTASPVSGPVPNILSKCRCDSRRLQVLNDSLKEGVLLSTRSVFVRFCIYIKVRKVTLDLLLAPLKLQAYGTLQTFKNAFVKKRIILGRCEYIDLQQQLKQNNHFHLKDKERRLLRF